MTLAGRYLSAGLVLSLTLIAGRLAGLLREMQLSATFGLSRDADFAIVLLTTPDLLVNLLLAGGLSAALIPEFSRLDAEGRHRLFVLACIVVGGVFGAIGLTVVLFPIVPVLVFAPGYAMVPVADYAWPFQLAALAIPLSGLAGVTTALLNGREKFFVAGSGTLIFNATIIAALALWQYPGNELVVLGTGIALAAFLRFGSQFVAAMVHINRPASASSPMDLSPLLQRFWQALGATTLVLLVPVVLRAVVSLNGAGNIAAYNFATKLVELPIGIAITTVSTVAFPALSKAFAEGNPEAVAKTFERAMSRGLAISLAIAIPAYWFAYPLVDLIFGRGRMSEDDLRLIAELARLGFITLPLVATSSLSAVLLNARHQSGLLLKVTLYCMAVLPVFVLPGILAGDVWLIVVALPAFHCVFALALAKATEQPILGNLRWLLRSAGPAAVLATAVTALFAGIASIVGQAIDFSDAIIAVLATGVSILVAGSIRGQTRS